MTQPVIRFSLTIKPARNFVTTDILRRILVDYFGYKLQFVMNVTDIDELVYSRAIVLWYLIYSKQNHPTFSTTALPCSIEGRESKFRFSTRNSPGNYARSIHGLSEASTEHFTLNLSRNL